VSRLILCLSLIFISACIADDNSLPKANNVDITQPEGGDTMYKVISDICYLPECGAICSGDLYLPEEPNGARVVLLIHGGAWIAMERTRFNGISEFLVKNGYAVYNIDYRLVPQAPFPACEDDCVAAAEFLLKAGHPEMNQLNLEHIFVMGGSAGGHLALMVGLRLPVEKVAGILNFSGPTDLIAPEIQKLVDHAKLCADEPERNALLQKSSPALIASGKPLPPLLVLHNISDSLVPVKQAHRIIDAWLEGAGELQVYLYSGAKDKAHDIWQPAVKGPMLYQKLEQQILIFLKTQCEIDTAE